MGGEVVMGFAAAPNAVARNILLSVGVGFVAAGFFSWAILQAKELTMAIADWIRGGDGEAQGADNRGSCSKR